LVSFIVTAADLQRLLFDLTGLTPNGMMARPHCLMRRPAVHFQLLSGVQWARLIDCPYVLLDRTSGFPGAV
jgi:hypothetical protein